MHEKSGIRVGSVIDGKYTLRAFIALGATGAVYRAENVWAGREYALKVFHYRGPDEQTALQRFVREAKAANRVHRDGRLHPHVVDTFDVGRDQATGQFYIVQELLEGETLAQYLDRLGGRRLTESEALAILSPVLDAIACAHDAGIVHRDLKPENIFLARGHNPDEPIVKVLDFGIAQISDARMTPNFELLGTPEYMAPEAFSGAGSVDARADVWALGAILHEMVSGRPPFGNDGDSPFDVMKCVMAVDPAHLASLGLLRHPTWIAVRRALARDLSRRYRTARELAEALEGAAAPTRTLRVPPGATESIVREILNTPPERSTSGRHSSVRGAESDHPSSRPPVSSWWSLVFTGTSMTVDGILAILAMPELGNLVELTVSDVPLGDTGIAALLGATTVQDVTTLTLRGVSMGPVGARALADSPTVANLARLDLEDNALGADGIAPLAQSPYLRDVRSLGLVCTAMDLRAAEILAASPMLPRLRRLELGQNSLGDDGAMALANTPSLDPALRLTLGRNGLSVEGLAVAQRLLAHRVGRLVL